MAKMRYFVFSVCRRFDDYLISITVSTSTVTPTGPGSAMDDLDNALGRGGGRFFFSAAVNYSVIDPQQNSKLVYIQLFLSVLNIIYFERYF